MTALELEELKIIMSLKEDNLKDSLNKKKNKSLYNLEQNKNKVNDLEDVNKVFNKVLDNSYSINEDDTNKQNHIRHLKAMEELKLELEFTQRQINLEIRDKILYKIKILLDNIDDFSKIWDSIDNINSYFSYCHLLNFSQYDKNGNTHLSLIVDNYIKKNISTDILYDVINKTNPNLLNKKDQNMIMQLTSLSENVNIFSNSSLQDIFIKKLYETDLKHHTISNENTFSFIIKNIRNYSSFLKPSDWNYLINNSELNLMLTINHDKYSHLNLETSILELILANRNFLGPNFDTKKLYDIIEKTNFNNFDDPNRFINKIFNLGSIHLLGLPNSDHILQILQKSNIKSYDNKGKLLLTCAFQSIYSDILDEKCWNYLLENTDLKSINNTFLFDFSRSFTENKINNFKEEQINYLLKNSDLNTIVTTSNNCNFSFLRLYLTNHFHKLNKLELNHEQINYVLENTNLCIENRETNSSTFSYFFSLSLDIHDESTQKFNITKNNLKSIITSLNKFNSHLDISDLNIFFQYLFKNKKENNEISHNITKNILQHYDITQVHETLQGVNISSILDSFSKLNIPDNLYASFIKKIPIEIQKKHLDVFSDFKVISFLNPLVLHDLNICEKLMKTNSNNFKYIGKHVIEYLELTQDNCLEKISNLKKPGLWGYFKNKETDKLQEKIFNSINYSLKSQLNFNDFYENQDTFLDNSNLFINENHQIRNKVKELEFVGTQYLTDFDNITLKKLLEDSYLKNLEIYSKISTNDNEAILNFKLVINNVNNKLDDFMSKMQENLILELKKESAIINFEQKKM